MCCVSTVYVSVKSKLQHAPPPTPRAYPGHTPGIWLLCRPGEEGIWLSESSRGWGIWSPCFRGGEFELHPRFHVNSLAWRPIMGDAACRFAKRFFGTTFQKLGNHSSFYEWNLGSNRAPKWRKLVLTSFRSLRASFPFISVAERQRLKLGMLEEKDTNCSRRLWRKITRGEVKSVPKIFGQSQQR